MNLFGVVFGSRQQHIVIITHTNINVHATFSQSHAVRSVQFRVTSLPFIHPSIKKKQTYSLKSLRAYACHATPVSLSTPFAVPCIAERTPSSVSCQALHTQYNTPQAVSSWKEGRVSQSLSLTLLGQCRLSIRWHYTVHKASKELHRAVHSALPRWEETLHHNKHPSNIILQNKKVRTPMHAL